MTAKRIAIITDSSASLPEELLSREGITTVPISFLFDDRVFQDGALSTVDFYERLRTSRVVPKTTSPSPGEFADAFRKAHEAGADGVLCLVMSSELSGTCRVAETAAEMTMEKLPRFPIRVVDTGGLAMTHGFAVLAAAEALRNGHSVDDAAETAVRVGSEAEFVGALDTMRYLAKGGRVPWIVHWAVAALRIKPVLAWSGGKVRPIARARTMDKALDQVLDFAAERVGGREARIAVMHAEAPERAAILAERARERFNSSEVIVTEFTTGMGVHTGPGFIGLAFSFPQAVKEGAMPAAKRAKRDAEVLERSLDSIPSPETVPAFVALSGLPGSGKTHVSRLLSDKYPFAVLNIDRLRKNLFASPDYNSTEHSRLFAAVHELIQRLLLRKISVLYDATNLRGGHRRTLSAIAERTGARFLLVDVRAPEDVIRARLTEREPGGDDSDADLIVYEKLRAGAEAIDHPHLVVESNGDINDAVDKIVEGLKEVNV
jgi:DegV family protein with EDD domain